MTDCTAISKGVRYQGEGSAIPRGGGRGITERGARYQREGGAISRGGERGTKGRRVRYPGEEGAISSGGGYDIRAGDAISYAFAAGAPGAKS